MEKSKIYYTFNKASSSYEEVAFVQQACAQKLVSLLQDHLPSFIPNSILDVGTGTGFVPEKLRVHFPFSHYTLNDIAPAMLDQARKKIFSSAHSTDYILGDMERLNFSPHSLVISNLAMQWADDLPALIHKLYQCADVLTFSCLLEGTFQEWSHYFKACDLLSPLCPYPSEQFLKDYLRSLQPKNVFYETQDIKIFFSNGKDFISYLKKLGAALGTYNLSLKDLKQILKISEDRLSVTYRVFFAVIERI